MLCDNTFFGVHLTIMNIYSKIHFNMNNHDFYRSQQNILFCDCLGYLDSHTKYLVWMCNIILYHYSVENHISQKQLMLLSINHSVVLDKYNMCKNSIQLERIPGAERCGIPQFPKVEQGKTKQRYETKTKYEGWSTLWQSKFKLILVPAVIHKLSFLVERST